MMEHDNPVTQIGDGFHHVFDHQKRHAGIPDLFNKSDRLVDFRRVEAGHDLIHEEKRREHRRGPGHFQTFTLRHVEALSRVILVPPETQEIQDFCGFTARRPYCPFSPGLAEQRTYHDVF